MLAMLFEIERGICGSSNYASCDSTQYLTLLLTKEYKNEFFQSFQEK